MTSCSPIFVSRRSSSSRRGTLCRCLTSSLIPWPSGLLDKWSLLSWITFFKLWAKAMTSSSPIFVSHRSSSSRRGTLCRCLASSLIPWPSGLLDNVSKRNLSTYFKAVASNWHSWFPKRTLYNLSTDSRGKWWRMFIKLTNSLVGKGNSYLITLKYERECVRVWSDVFLVKCKELQTSWFPNTWSGSWREDFGADINGLNSSMDFWLVQFVNSGKQKTNRCPTFLMKNSSGSRSRYLFTDFTSP